MRRILDLVNSDEEVEQACNELRDSYGGEAAGISIEIDFDVHLSVVQTPKVANESGYTNDDKRFLKAMRIKS